MIVSFAKCFIAVFTLTGLLFASAPFTVSAAHIPNALSVSFRTTDGKEHTLSIPSANVGAGGSLAVADLGNDGVSEILVTPGIGNEPRVHILRADGSEITSFLAYAPSMGTGINVIACDLDGNGTQEIITAPQRGGGPHLRIFNATGDAIDAGGSFVYAETFKGGVNLACGNTDTTPGDELITLPAAGGGPHVRVWKWTSNTLTLTKEWFAGSGTERAGLVGAVAQNGNLWLATSKGLPARLIAYNLKQDPLLVEERSIFAQPDGTGVESLLVAEETLIIGLTGISKTITYTPSSNTWKEQITTVVSPVFGIGDVDGDGTLETVTMPGRPLYGGTEDTQSIVVDLGEQRLYAYENGVLANTFLVSTGKAPYKTPIGTHHILAKVDQVHYAGRDLDGTAWDLGWVPYNLRFFPKYYIHYAYWHNNFGHPMSHGCVNVNLTNMKWIYAWAEVNATMIVRE